MAPQHHVAESAAVHKDSKTAVCERLVYDWARLADHFDISLAERAAFTPGRQPHGVWEWLDQRKRLAELAEGLVAIHRKDLIKSLPIDLLPKHWRTNTPEELIPLLPCP